MPRRLEYLAEALAEAEAAARWYADRSPLAAQRFSEELDDAEAAILDAPETWPAFDHGARRFLLKHFPFSVVYQVFDRRVLIVAVAHAYRRPLYWQARVDRPR